MEEISLKSFPKQKLSFDDKNSMWRENCVDGVINLCTSIGRSRRSSNENKIRNYNILNNKVDKADFTYVLNPFNLSKDKLNTFQLPASLQPYDVLSPIFNLLFGEEGNRNFNPIVRAINEAAISSKLEKKKSIIMELLTEQLTAAFEGQEELSEDKISQYLNYSPKDMRESVATKLLNYYMRKLNVKDMHMKGWKHALIAGEEIYRIDQVGDAPKPVVVNPLELEFILPNNSDFIDESPMIHELNYMTLPEIIDDFYEYLKPEQIEELESNYKSGEINMIEYLTPSTISEVESIYHFGDGHSKKGIRVNRVRWKSFKKMGILHIVDIETGEEFEDLVDENFVITDPDTQFIEWFWVNEYWEGIRIGSDMYLNIRPRKNQFRTIDNPSSCKSGYIGTVYSALNSPSVSLMDRLVPWLYLYLIIWYNTELLISTNMGKIGLIDVSVIPDNWDIEKWMYYVKAMKIGFVNSYNEGEKAAKFGQVNQSTQTKNIDLELGNSIQFYINLLEVIEQKIEMTSGISRQRKGSITSSELVGNTERAVQQSSHITEEWFRVHNGTKIRFCESLLEVAKDCFQGKVKNFQYVTDDLAEVMFTVMGDEFAEIDYGVMITDSVKDMQALQTIKEYIGQALQSDKIEFSQIIDVFNSDSLADIKNKAKQSEKEKHQRESEMQNQQLQAEQAMHQEQLMIKQSEMELDKYIADSNNETKITVAEIGAFSRQDDLDTDDDGIPDPIEIADVAIKNRKQQSDEFNKKMEIDSKQRIEKAKLTLEEKKIKSKEKIEKLKADTQKYVARKNKNKFDK